MGKEAVIEVAESNRELVESVARKLWEEPEVGLEEHRSAERLVDSLEEAGFEVDEGVAQLPTGFVAEYGEGEPVIATQCEYDALPGLSQQVKDEPDPVEEGGAGHGCGHNLFAAGGLGGALTVKSLMDREDLPGTIRVYGTPAEELHLGKPYMIHHGLYDDVDAVVTWHSAWLPMPDRGSTTALDKLEFEFSGTSSHPGMSPEAIRSGFDAAQLMNTGVEFMREHLPDSTRLHYTVEDTPGNEYDSTTVSYTIGAPRIEQLEAVTEWVEQVAEGAALMTQTDHRSRTANRVYNVLPNQTLCDVIYDNMTDIGAVDFDDADQSLAESLQDTLEQDVMVGQLGRLGLDDQARADVLAYGAYPDPMDPGNEGNVAGYATDTGNVSWVVPTGRFFAPGWAVGTPAHSWQAVAASGSFGIKAAVYASKVIAGSIYDLLTDEPTLRAVRAEFDDQMGDRSYESPLPEDPDPPSDR